MIEKILETDSGNVHYWMSVNILEDRKTIFFLLADMQLKARVMPLTVQMVVLHGKTAHCELG